ncbi:hypothetical protein Tco_0493969 [Tanacetum coccineum]
MVVWCSVVMECEGGDDDDDGTVVMGTGFGGGVGDDCGLPRRWGWQDDGGAYADGGGEMVMRLLWVVCGVKVVANGR